MKRRLSLPCCGLIAAAVALVGVAGPDVRAVGDWRSVWDIKLSSSDSHGVPEAFTLRLRNLGESTLQGSNAVFALYVGGSIFGWASDEKLQARTLSISPGEVITETVPFDTLKFSDLHGNDLDRRSVVAQLKSRKWKVRVTFLDLSTPKPPQESNLTVWSNWLLFDNKTEM